jgi:hypothetical protein
MSGKAYGYSEGLEQYGKAKLIKSLVLLMLL